MGLRRVFGAKVSGLELWTSTAALQPACCQVLFSSVSSLLGSPGQANYSAANAVQDATAQAMAQRGSPVLAVQWGAWAGGGMAAQDKRTAVRLERLGMALIQPLDGLRVLEGKYPCHTKFSTTMLFMQCQCLHCLCWAAPYDHVHQYMNIYALDLKL